MTPGCLGHDRERKRFRFCGCPCGHYWDEMNNLERDPVCPNCGNEKGELSTIIVWDDWKEHMEIEAGISDEKTFNLPRL